MDEIDFAREQLRRAVLAWANEVLPSILDAAEEVKDESVKVVPEAMILMSFPTDDFMEYRDLVVARLETIKAERGGR
jgi:hypothetical protein